MILSGLAACPPAKRVGVTEERVESFFTNRLGRVVADFGKAGFGYLMVHATKPGTCVFAYGEKIAPSGDIDRFIGGSVRSSVAQFTVDTPGWCRVPFAPITRHYFPDQAGMPVSPPDEFGVVAPFRAVEVLRAPFEITPDAFKRMRIAYPMDLTEGSFVCDDARLNRVYEFCKYSVWATSFCGIMVDGDRERIPYEADAYATQLAHYGMSSDYAYARKTIEHLYENPTWPTEFLQSSVMSAWLDWMYTGDVSSAGKWYDVLRREKLLARFARKTDGLVVSGGERKGGDKFNALGLADIVDWPPSERDGFEFREVNAVVNAFHYRNLLEMTDLAEALGRREDSRRFAADAKKQKESFNRVLFDEGVGLYRDGEGTDHHSLHANVAALVCGLVPDARRHEVAAWIAKRGMACSTYFSNFLLTALFENGREDDALRLMASDDNRSWLGMLKQGATMTMESWNMHVKPNQDWNHSWSAHPVGLVAREICGVRPLKPGFERIGIAPHIGKLSHIKAKVPTAKGPVGVSYDEGVFTVDTPAPSRFVFKGITRELEKGRHVIYVDRGILWTLSDYATISNGQLVVDVPIGVHDGRIFGATAYVGLEPFEGRSLGAKVMASGENIALPANSCHGLKLMLHFQSSVSGDDCWPDAPHRIGSFGKTWLEVGDTLSGGARSPWGTIHVGLQGTSGKVVFDMNTFEITSGESIFPRENGNYRVAYPDAVAKRPQLRGVQLPANRCTEDDFKTLAAWGATLARYQMTNAPHVQSGETPDQALPRYFAWLDAKLDHLDKEVLSWADKYGIDVVIDLHEPPGKRVKGSGEFRMMVEKPYCKAFLDAWRKIATRFKGRNGIYGYDLVNEPNQSKKTKVDYWTVQKLAAEEVRKIDTDTPIIIESNGMDSPRTFTYLSPLAMDNVIYEVHMYEPGDYTHQGVRGEKDFARLEYPMGDRNRDYLVKSLAAVRKFEEKHHAKIYVGEFSAAGWAPGADQYLRDCISIFKEYGWDWTYHAFREWPGWSVEHEPVKYGVADDCFKPSADNPRKRALIDGLRGK
ncbi:MAG: cellulase family glycosylhydrolase [Bacteroidales bacterium]|nr:cellulase family glycosylhydrolase [Bacteroidales bacterium]